MRRRPSRKAVAEVAAAYVQELSAKFPGIQTEVVPEGIDGFDLWIRVELPEEMADRREEIRDETVDLDWQFFDSTGVFPVATVIVDLPAAARGR